MPYYNIDLTTTARLPGLDIEVVHRHSPRNDREEILITLPAVPSRKAPLDRPHAKDSNRTSPGHGAQPSCQST
jgi:hypothetical protein